MGEWISVNDRLPKEWEPVLAMVLRSDFSGERPIIESMWYIGNIGGKDKWRVCWNADMLESDVTHWMPLPDPPKEE